MEISFIGSDRQIISHACRYLARPSKNPTYSWRRIPKAANNISFESSLSPFCPGKDIEQAGRNILFADRH